MSRNSHSRFPARIESRVSRFIEEHHLLGAGEKVLVAISGGADSTALLLILERLLKKKAIAIVAAHFDHRLRGPVEGEADLAFVQGLIGDLGVDCVTGGGEVRQHARRKKISLEDAARSLRYQFLASEASRLGAGVVATGHTKDDQAETVLLHILRGSGVDGLRGMRPRSSWPLGPGPQLIRPLLILSREETRRYCGDRGIVPREDYTNLLLEATRNRIRHQALPLLKEFNPRLTDALQRLADAAALDSEYLNTLAEAHWGELARIEKRAVVLDRKVFQGLPPALGLRLLRKAVEAFMEHPPQLEAVHLHAVLAALSKERSRVSLPLDLELEITARHLRLRPGRPPAVSPIPQTPLAIPGHTSVPGWTISAELVKKAGRFTFSDNPLEAHLDAEAVGASPLYVRSRLPGDRMRPLGLGGEKKLQDILVDAKVPVSERDAIPIIYNDNGIVWVVGLRVAQAAAITPRTREVLHLQAKPKASP